MSKNISPQECEELYRKYSTPEHVILHCKAVTNVALGIAEKLNDNGFNFNLDLIRGAGLAHDVARTSEDHGKVGAEILSGLGYNDEAEIVRVHMRFDFHPFEEMDETDMVCLGDRLVKEHDYVGLEKRMEYIMDKVPNTAFREQIIQHILEKKAETKHLIDQIEERIGQTLESLFK